MYNLIESRFREMDKTPFTKQEMIEYVDKRGYIADVDSMWDWYEKVDFKYPLGRCLCKIKNWKADVNLKLRAGKFGAHKKGEKAPIRKIKLYPIKGKNCNFRMKEGICGMPAVYRLSNTAYDNYRCSEHLPIRVMEKYE